ncbi:hypothetical protein AC578_10731 [Pseudocercospora eumusae]|uniref:RecA family profile 1 domain-containing protein n=1 Tax=Pseudocercospora eumusae TaxID=321146 RepID=A0A139H4R3_9PEZI|nr:hypothetical protein AC578_10731 [Pseudocercospora eumusae]KXS97351.1 hypothetical protein AC578_10731 [Pseudocercospora eumusae]
MPASVATSEQEEDDYQPVLHFIVDVDQLTNHGINASDVSKLKSSSYYTIGQVMNAHSKVLKTIKGYSEQKVEKVKEAARKCQPHGFTGMMTAQELLIRRKSCFRIQTGSKQWDTILGGGFESRSVNEVYGEYRCGKTQLSHTMCVMAQVSIHLDQQLYGSDTSQKPKSEGGAEGKVAVINTEGTFRPERVAQVAEYHQMDPETVNENILYVRALNSEHQHDSLIQMAESFATGEYRLLIVDSILNLFRSDYQGRGELNERQQRLGIHLRKLAEFAEEFNITVFMTNQVQSDPGASALFAGADGRKPVGGHVLAHASATRVLLRKGRGEERVAKIMDSPDCPEAEATYVITAGGINDPDKA